MKTFRWVIPTIWQALWELQIIKNSKRLVVCRLGRFFLPGRALAVLVKIKEDPGNRRAVGVLGEHGRGQKSQAAKLELQLSTPNYEIGRASCRERV